MGMDPEPDSELARAAVVAADERVAAEVEAGQAAEAARVARAEFLRRDELGWSTDDDEKTQRAESQQSSRRGSTLQP
jgi:hypothetical protein